MDHQDSNATDIGYTLLLEILVSLYIDSMCVTASQLTLRIYHQSAQTETKLYTNLCCKSSGGSRNFGYILFPQDSFKSVPRLPKRYKPRFFLHSIFILGLNQCNKVSGVLQNSQACLHIMPTLTFTENKATAEHISENQARHQTIIQSICCQVLFGQKSEIGGRQGEILKKKFFNFRSVGDIYTGQGQRGQVKSLHICTVQTRP